MNTIKEYMNDKKQDDFVQTIRPIKVLQFGEGNFLRGFVDYMIDVANEAGSFDGSIAIIKPLATGNLDSFYKQDYQYTVSLRGIVDNVPKVINRPISSVSKALDSYTQYEDYMELATLDTLELIVSNTTEAGIVFDSNDQFLSCPPNTYPGKLTKFLYERYKYFHGDLSKGVYLLPVELIDHNGQELERCVKQFANSWQLEGNFIDWLDHACTFCSTLVDRIVTGFPKDNYAQICQELGYTDDLLVTAEPFALWVIEDKNHVQDVLPLNQANLPVLFVRDISPYKERKVRILNGAHTSFVLASFLCGNNTVLDSMNDSNIYTFLTHTLYEEIIPTLSLSKEELYEFTASVFTRFKNPYVKHMLLSISLNSVSKWKARCMPSFLKAVQTNDHYPICLAFSLAALIQFYCGEKQLQENALQGMRGNESYQITDDPFVISFFYEHAKDNAKDLTHQVLTNTQFWGMDLTQISGAEEFVSKTLEDIRSNGMKKALENFLTQNSLGETK